MIKASLRGLLQRKLRLALAVIAIVLSVGFLSGSIVLGDTLNARFAGLFSTINENVAVQVTAKDPDAAEPARLSQADLDRLSRVDGVAQASGDVSAEGVIPFRTDTGKAVTAQVGLAAGVDSRGDTLGLVELREGAWPARADEVVLSANTAKLAKAQRGTQLKVFVPQLGEARTYTVSGIAGFAGGRDSLAGETLVMFELKHAQELFYGTTGVYASASFGAASGVSQDELKKRIERELPSGFKAQTGKEATEEASNALGDSFGIFTIILSAFAGVAAFVGIFLIYNTFNIIVAQRSRELALLRAMGASWGQVIRAVLLEALVVGGFGATLGLGFGIAVGVGAEALLSNMLGVDLPSGGVVVSMWAVLWSYVVGLIVTMIAAFIPAVKASMVPPIAAMRETVRPDKSLLGLSITGGAFLVPGAGLVALALTGIGSATTLVLAGGVVLVFLGVALLSPLLAKPVVRLLGWLLGRGQAGKLGVRNALRNPRRTAVTAAALMIGVTLITTAATVAQSFKSSIEDIVGQNTGVDIMILGPNTGPPNGEIGFNPAALDEVKKLPGVTDTAAWHITIEAAIAGTPAFISAADVPTAKRMWQMQEVGGQLRTLGAQEMVVDDNMAEASRWKAGDQVTVGIGQTSKKYTIVGIYKRTPTLQGPILGLPAVDDFAGKLAYQGFVSLDDGADVAGTVAKVEDIMSDYPGVTVGDMSSFARQQSQAFDVLVNAITILLGVALLIALLGIINTLLLSIVERTRELGLVRAVGLSRGGVVRMVGVESVLISVFGCLLGVTLGVGLGAAFVKALIDLDFMSKFALPWANLAVYVGAALVFGVVAALWPARRAAKLNVLEAIAYE
ncbi:ABC transporter permease [Allorhizocola rhizosphaerae]|uniref:ABC transporter permease n=1 Tax=Allorhizocola rhizosphaerae TaxID=1872709 RepID=UPI000E3E85DE|nr:ABC transporter permease [Allorhizocola rhizosphaerae]